MVPFLKNKKTFFLPPFILSAMLCFDLVCINHNSQLKFHELLKRIESIMHTPGFGTHFRVYIWDYPIKSLQSKGFRSQGYKDAIANDWLISSKSPVYVHSGLDEGSFSNSLLKISNNVLDMDKPHR